MRKFKFRAWDKVHKEMMNWDKYKDELVADDFTDDDLAIMQYTGLKDRTGTEIYEGDIGRWHIARGNESILFEVLWIEEEARFIGRYRDEYDNYRFISLINSDKALGIIGNIYENSELLELRS